MLFGYLESLAEFSGAGKELVRFGCFGPICVEGGGVGKGLGGADEDGGWVLVGVGNDVEHVVESVGDIDVGMARGAVHGGVFGCLASVGVAPGVVSTGVSLDFNNLNDS